MSFTTLSITGTVESAPGNAVPNAVVTLLCNSQISDGTVDLVPQAIVTSCNSSGQFTMAGVPANDDSTTVPTGTYYQVTITKSGQIIDSFNVIVPKASAPSVNLFSLSRLSGALSVATPFVTSVEGLNGIVTVESPDSSVTVGTSGNAITLEVASGSGISSVSAADLSIVATTTSGAVSLETGTLDKIASLHAPAANWSNNSKKITSLANGTASSDAAAFGQIPTAASAIGGLEAANDLSDVSDAGTSQLNLGVSALPAAACVATSNVSLSGLQTIDGYTLASGDYALLTGQTTASQNGLWAAASGSWTRPTVFASAAVVHGRTCAVINGTANANTLWVLDAPTAGVTIDTSSQTWTKASGTSSQKLAQTAETANFNVSSAYQDYAVTSSSATTGTIQSGASTDIEAWFTVTQLGAGAVTLAAASGVSFATGSILTTTGQGQQLTARQIATDEWLVTATHAGGGGQGLSAQATGTFTVIVDDQNTGSTYGAENTEYCIPFVVSEQITINSLSVLVKGVGGTGAVVRLGIRDDNGSNLPGTLVVDAGTASGTATGWQTASNSSLATTLNAGRYWLSFVSQGSSTLPSLETGTPSPCIARSSGSALARWPAGWAEIVAYNTATVSGALPTTPTSPDIADPSQSISNGKLPVIAIGF